MKGLLGHGRTNGISSLLCALERGRAEQQTRDTGCEMRLFVPRFGSVEGESGFAGHWYGIARKRGVCMVQMRVSPRSIPHLLGHCFGTYATPGGKLALLLCYHPTT
jgi:hypothetical protein